ncbi:MAG: BofC C-terminal domain-containing protein [Clostridia bacterium]|nr:BofC C-terminal domain-containing protein [Clostridia bacterium]
MYGSKIGAQGQNSISDEIVVSEKNNKEEEEKTVSANADDIKVTPNTLLILKRYYADCGHTIINNAEIPEEMVNLTEKEVENGYQGWKIEKFTKEEVILAKELDSFCGEHYLLLEEEGRVLIYSLDEAGNKTIKEDTDIAFEYLPETDKIILQNGIYVYGTEELSRIKEDFES